MAKRQIRQIADSISAFGFTNPILVDRAATIVAGRTSRSRQVVGITDQRSLRQSLSQHQTGGASFVPARYESLSYGLMSRAGLFLRSFEPL